MQEGVTATSCFVAASLLLLSVSSMTAVADSPLENGGQSFLSPTSVVSGAVSPAHDVVHPIINRVYDVDCTTVECDPGWLRNNDTEGKDFITNCSTDACMVSNFNKVMVQGAQSRDFETGDGSDGENNTSNERNVVTMFVNAKIVAAAIIGWWCCKTYDATQEYM